MVAHAALTCDELEDEPSSDPDVDSTSSSSSYELERKPRKGKRLTLITPSAIAHHTKQVIRMLPGGLTVVGLYAVEPVENLFTSKYETIIKSLISSGINKGLNKNPFYGNSGLTSDRIILHYNPSSKLFSCKLTDCTKTVKIEPTFRTLEWSKLECDYDTMSAMQITKNNWTLPLKKNLQSVLHAFQETLSGAKFIVDGALPSKHIVYVEKERQPTEEVENGLSDLLGGRKDEHDNLGEGLSLALGVGGFGDQPIGPDMSEEMCRGGESDDDSCGLGPISPLHILVDKLPVLFPNTDGMEGIPGSNGGDFVNHLHMQGKLAAIAFVSRDSSTQHVVDVSILLLRKLL